PLVDVVLVLLVIFMVTAPMIAARGIVVNTPKAAAGESVQSPLKLTMNEDGVLHIGDTPYPDDQWPAAAALVRQAVAADPEVKAVIDADQAVPYGRVMEVIDMVKAAGITKFALSTAPKKKPTPPADPDDDDAEN